MSVRLNPDNELCASCGKVAEGSAHIDGKRYCHGDDQRPSCYELHQWARAGRHLQLLLDDITASRKEGFDERT